eukprot:gene4379-794_t
MLSALRKGLEEAIEAGSEGNQPASQRDLAVREKSRRDQDMFKRREEEAAEAKAKVASSDPSERQGPVKPASTMPGPTGTPMGGPVPSQPALRTHPRVLLAASTAKRAAPK